ncbi:restriction endonuclease [Streptomyces sirii]|uniref:restriction endonuclease n=1 Tax=Streptomyces sirii TaxID=3127701 RepID=UPI003D363E0B
MYDPTGRIEAELPLDRGPHEHLAKSVLAWTGSPGLAKADYEQIALQLTGAARAVSNDVRRAAYRLPQDHAARVLAEYVLAEAERRLSVRLEGTVRCVQGRARLVRVLYDRLDRLASIPPHRPLGIWLRT